MQSARNFQFRGHENLWAIIREANWPWETNPPWKRATKIPWRLVARKFTFSLFLNLINVTRITSIKNIFQIDETRTVVNSFSIFFIAICYAFSTSQLRFLQTFDFYYLGTWLVSDVPKNSKGLLSFSVFVAKGRYKWW